MEPHIPDEELVRLLTRIDEEMGDDPRVKETPITSERYYSNRMPHYLRKFRVLKENEKL